MWGECSGGWVPLKHIVPRGLCNDNQGRITNVLELQLYIILKNHKIFYKMYKTLINYLDSNFKIQETYLLLK